MLFAGERRHGHADLDLQKPYTMPLASLSKSASSRACSKPLSLHEVSHDSDKLKRTSRHSWKTTGWECVPHHEQKCGSFLSEPAEQYRLWGAEQCTFGESLISGTLTEQWMICLHTYNVHAMGHRLLAFSGLTSVHHTSG